MLKPVPVEPVLSVKELYTLYYFHHESGYRFAGESHDFWEIIYVDKGRASGINGTEPYTLEKGQIIFTIPMFSTTFERTARPTLRMARTATSLWYPSTASWRCWSSSGTIFLP